MAATSINKLRRPGGRLPPKFTGSTLRNGRKTSSSQLLQALQEEVVVSAVEATVSEDTPVDDVIMHLEGVLDPRRNNANEELDSPEQKTQSSRHPPLGALVLYTYRDKF